MRLKSIEARLPRQFAKALRLALIQGRVTWFDGQLRPSGRLTGWRHFNDSGASGKQGDSPSRREEALPAPEWAQHLAGMLLSALPVRVLSGETVRGRRIAMAIPRDMQDSVIVSFWGGDNGSTTFANEVLSILAACAPDARVYMNNIRLSCGTSESPNLETRWDPAWTRGGSSYPVLAEIAERLAIADGLESSQPPYWFCSRRGYKSSREIAVIRGGGRGERNTSLAVEPLHEEYLEPDYRPDGMDRPEGMDDLEPVIVEA